MDYSFNEQKLITKALQLLESKFQIQPDTFLSPPTVILYLRFIFSEAENEQFVVLFLNNQNQLICKETLFLGTINHVEVHPREVVKQALKHNAAAVIFAHNHPSGMAEPSESDRRITQILSDALAMVDIRVLDHIVIGHKSHVSFTERGWL